MIIQSLGSKEKINNAQIVTAIAKDKIAAGDTVYVAKGEFNKPVSQIYADNEQFPFTDYIPASAFSPDSKLLIICSGMEPRVYSIEGPNVTYLYTLEPFGGGFFNDRFYGAEFSPDGALLVLSGGYGANHRVYIYQVDGVNISPLQYVEPTYIGDDTPLSTPSRAGGVSFHPDGTQFVVTSDAIITSYDIDIASGEVTESWKDSLNDESPEGYMDGGSAKYSKDGSCYLYFEDYDDEGWIYKANNFSDFSENAVRVPISGNHSYSSISPDGNMLAIATGYNSGINFVSIADGNISYLARCITEFQDMFQIEFIPDSNTLAVYGYELNSTIGMYCFYSVNGTSLSLQNKGYISTNAGLVGDSMSVSSDGKYIVMGVGRYGASSTEFQAHLFYATDKVIPAPSGIIAPGSTGTFPFGFAKTSAEAGEEVTVKTVGAIKVLKQITFTIGSSSYTALEGMTWAEWVNSDYNTGGYKNTGISIMPATTQTVTGPNESVLPTDFIIENYSYTLSAGGGSND